MDRIGSGVGRTIYLFFLHSNSFPFSSKVRERRRSTLNGVATVGGGASFKAPYTVHAVTVNRTSTQSSRIISISITMVSFILSAVIRGDSIPGVQYRLAIRFPNTRYLHNRLIKLTKRGRFYPNHDGE